MTEQYLKDGLKKIDELGVIVSVAWHVKHDADFEDINRVRFEDTEGKTVEILLHDPMKQPLLNEIDHVLINILLQKCFEQAGIDGNLLWIGVNSTVTDAVNKARQMMPYTGKHWVNEERARRYDSETPEFVF